MKIFKRGFVLIFSVLLSNIFLLSCSDDEPNSAPQISSITSSNSIVGYGNSISLSVNAVDNDNDSLIYEWSSNGGTFSNNNLGQSVTWTAPELSLNNIALTYTITLTVSDGKKTTEKSISIEAVPMYNNFNTNELLNFIASTNCTYTFDSNQFVIESITDGKYSSIYTPEFVKRLELPFTIETTLGVMQEFVDPISDHYYISLNPSYPGGSINKLLEIGLYLYPNQFPNWKLVAKTKEDLEYTYTILTSGQSNDLNGIGFFNKLSLTIDKSKNVIATINGVEIYNGDVLSNFITDNEYSTSWKLYSASVNISSVNNFLTVEEIIVR